MGLLLLLLLLLLILNIIIFTKITNIMTSDYYYLYHIHE